MPERLPTLAVLWLGLPASLPTAEGLRRVLPGRSERSWRASPTGPCATAAEPCRLGTALNLVRCSVLWPATRWVPKLDWLELVLPRVLGRLPLLVKGEGVREMSTSPNNSCCGTDMTSIHT